MQSLWDLKNKNSYSSLDIVLYLYVPGNFISKSACPPVFLFFIEEKVWMVFGDGDGKMGITFVTSLMGHRLACRLM